jgi:NTP pyrophosphatase (non-canonical NTP hydrolase)
MNMFYYQSAVVAWAKKCFGEHSANEADLLNRGHRFLEEAIELAQSVGVSRKDAELLLDYTYNRPVGETYQEIGGVMVTLAGLAASANIQMAEAAKSELDRVEENVEKIRAKSRSKPLHSPLPGVAV